MNDTANTNRTIVWHAGTGRRGIRNKPEPANQVAELFVYDEIGYWGITAKDMAAELEAIGPVDELTVRLNSPGGDVFDGFAIYNLLLQNPAKVLVKIDGLAASAASVVAMAGDTIAMASNSSMMIHGAWTVTVGDAPEHISAAKRLDVIDGQMRDMYSAKSGNGLLQIAEWMNAETWWTAEEAVAIGMADVVSDAASVAAMAGKPPWIQRLPAAFGKLPDNPQIIPPHRVSAARRERELTLRRQSVG